MLFVADTFNKLDKAGENMSLEAIKVVKTAELDAENLRISALAEAKKIVTAADTGGKEDVQKARKSAESMVQTLCREAENKGKEIAAISAEKVRDKCLHLEKEAESRMSKAVAKIMERVMSGQ
jgi:vacuolar-type H+-ATPase subunit H